DLATTREFAGPYHAAGEAAPCVKCRPGVYVPPPDPLSAIARAGPGSGPGEEGSIMHRRPSPCHACWLATLAAPFLLTPPAVTHAGPMLGWAVGKNGTILHTSDGGITWVPQNSSTSNELEGVSFPDPNNGWAVGEHGTIVHTGDGGLTWARQQ